MPINKIYFISEYTKFYYYCDKRCNDNKEKLNKREIVCIFTNYYQKNNLSNFIIYKYQNNA